VIAATPTLTLGSREAVIGGPLEMQFRFEVAADAPPFPEDGWVFVHFLDTAGEMMWTDDHQPPTPMSLWAPGQTIEYTRTVFVPKIPYVGETDVEIGLMSKSTGQRMRLEGEAIGQRGYRVATFDMRLQADAVFVVFKDGWHNVEQAEGSMRQWQWSTGAATLAFRNPRRDARLFLQLDRSDAIPEPQQVRLTLGDQEVDAFTLAPGQADLRRIPLSAGLLGDGDVVELQMTVDRTFVPARVPSMAGGDTRELGVRVFHAFLEVR